MFKHVFSTRQFVTLAGAALLAVTLIACGGSDAAPTSDAPAETAQAEPVTETMVASKLAAADLLDGEEDHVVSQCAGCALAMEGSADYALQVQDYELHFCSDSCRDGFSEDVMAKVAHLEVPESEATR